MQHARVGPGGESLVKDLGRSPDRAGVVLCSVNTRYAWSDQERQMVLKGMSDGLLISCPHCRRFFMAVLQPTGLFLLAATSCDGLVSVWLRGGEGWGDRGGMSEERRACMKFHIIQLSAPSSSRSRSLSSPPSPTRLSLTHVFAVFPLSRPTPAFPSHMYSLSFLSPLPHPPFLHTCTRSLSSPPPPPTPAFPSHKHIFKVECVWLAAR